MPSYPRLSGLLAKPRSPASAGDFSQTVIPYLVDVWLTDYTRTTSGGDIVQVDSEGFSYLFDVSQERLIAAWGISRGANKDPRDASRMRGHPQSHGPLYHRGHAIPHSLGGPTDINLVPQRGSVNIGPFRALEREAVRNPGALYYTYWIYAASTTQKPQSVEQGLLVPGQNLRKREHPN
jgi:DNA/RNA non-specific endonuclease